MNTEQIQIPPRDCLFEAAAKAIYQSFVGSEEHPWVENGNSTTQDTARRYARAALGSISVDTNPYDTLSLLEAHMSRDPEAYNTPGTVVYQVTRDEVIDFVGELRNKFDIANREENISLHRQLAAAKLEAKQGWDRVVSKNRELEQVRQRLALSESKTLKVDEDPIELGLLDNTTLEVSVCGVKGPGRDHHVYHIEGFDTVTNEAFKGQGFGTPITLTGLMIFFQNGSPVEKGWNGVTLEALLTVCGHRLQDCQKGPYGCEENQTALNHIKAAIRSLDRRVSLRNKYKGLGAEDVLENDGDFVNIWGKENGGLNGDSKFREWTNSEIYTGTEIILNDFDKKAE